mgnify:CR=1 FL=1
MSEGKSKMYELIGRAIADPDFRTALMVDPDKAIRDHPFTQGIEEIAVKVLEE